MRDRLPIPVWKVLVVLTALVSAFIGFIVWDVRRRTEAYLADQARDVVRRQSELDAAPIDRRPFEGPGREGDAWESYAKAIEGLKILTPDDEAALPRLVDIADFVPDDPRIAVLLDRLRPSMGDLRAGTHARTFVRTHRWPGPEGDGDYADPFGCLQLAKVHADFADHLHRKGRDEEAAELLALGLFFAQDVRRHGLLINATVAYAMESEFAWSARLMLAEHSLSAGALRRWAGRIARQQEDRYSWDGILDADIVYGRATLLDWASRGGGAFRPTPGWRQCFSHRIMAARGLSLYHRTWEELKPLLSRPFPDQIEQARALEERLRESAFNGEDFLLPAVGRYTLLEAEALLRHILLRLAIALACFEVETGAAAPSLQSLVPDYFPEIPACPVSGLPLRYEEGRVWSVGVDGVDDGGLWQTELDVEVSRPDPDCPDIVWKAGRKK